VRKEVVFSDQLPERRRLVRLLLAGNHIFTRAYHQVSVKSACPLPARGPAILVCNHVSALDPLLVQSGIRHRLVTWMMAAEYYGVRGLSWLFETVEVIPVQRSGRDLAATRMALRALHSGRILGIFPEGKIALSRELLPFQTGVALLAIKANVPVFPAYLDGTQRGKEMVEAVVWPNRASLRFGPQVMLDASSTSRESLEENTQRIRQAILHLQAQATERYNGHNA
jgi:1-acyl-sn-glycerol-3-phosphate acyltransferase